MLLLKEISQIKTFWKNIFYKNSLKSALTVKEFEQ